MSKLLLLTKVLLKNSFSLGTFKSEKKKKAAIIGLVILILFVILCCCVPITIFLSETLEYLPIGKIIISAIIPIAGITTIIFSVLSLVSVFYMNKDGDMLLTMPVKSRDIFMAKFLTALVTEYYLLFLFIFPCLIGIGIGMNAGFLYYVYSILVFILIPLIPSCIVALIILVITKLFGDVLKKDTFTYISMALILVFTLGYDYLVMGISETEDSTALISSISALENSIIPIFRKIFPFYNSASTSLIEYDNVNGIFSFLTFLAINIVSLLILSFVGDKLYVKSLISGGNSSNKVKKEIVLNKDRKGSTLELFKKEWLIIKRTPNFMLNIVIVSFLMPVVFCFSFFMGLSSGGEFDYNFFSEYVNEPFVYLIVLASLTFLTCGSAGAATAISREGSNAYIMKTIPVSYFKQVNVKVIFASLVDIISTSIFLIVVSIVFKIPFYYFVLCLISLILIDFILNYGSILFDLKNPKINWSEENAAVKSNFNALYSALITFGMCAILGVGAYFAYDLQMNVVIFGLILILVLSLILLMIILLFYKKNNSLLDQVD